MLEFVAPILGFGFLGLSFLMLYLGYNAMQQVNASETPDASRIDLCKFFLKIALIFMVAAGPLQWATLYVDRVLVNDTVTLSIAIPNQSWKPEFGDIAVFRNGEYTTIVARSFKSSFSDDEEIMIDVSSVVDSIRAMQAQIQASTTRLVGNAPAARAALEGG